MRAHQDLGRRATRIRRLGVVGGSVGIMLFALLAIAGDEHPARPFLRVGMLVFLTTLLWAQSRLRTMRAQAQASGSNLLELQPLSSRDRFLAAAALATGVCFVLPLVFVPFVVLTDRISNPVAWSFLQRVPAVVVAGAYVAWWGADRLAEIRSSRSMGAA